MLGMENEDEMWRGLENLEAETSLVNVTVESMALIKATTQWPVESREKKN
jgi:hypothetical protein